MKCPHCGAVFEPERPEDSQNVSSIQENDEAEQRVKETGFDQWLSSLPNRLETSGQKTGVGEAGQLSEKLESLEDHEENLSRQDYRRRVQKALSHVLGTKQDHRCAVDRLDEILEKPRGTTASLDDTGL